MGLGQSSDNLAEQHGKIFKDFSQYSGAKCEPSRELRRSDETTWTRVAVTADGFAGGTADAFTLFERFEAKLDLNGPAWLGFP